MTKAGIVSEVGHAGRSYQVMTSFADTRYIDPDARRAAAPRKQGSWWPVDGMAQSAFRRIRRCGPVR